MNLSHEAVDEARPPHAQPLDTASLDVTLQELGVGGVLTREIQVGELDPVVVVPDLQADAVEIGELG